MLVLALQFSKGSEAGPRHTTFSHRGGRTAGSGSLELHADRRGRGPEIWVDSLKTEEKTKFVEPAGQEDESCDWLAISTDPPVHQLGVVRTG